MYGEGLKLWVITLTWILGTPFNGQIVRLFHTIPYNSFHIFAVQDRVDLSSASDLPCDGVIDVAKLLPTNSDHECMRKEFCVLGGVYTKTLSLQNANFSLCFGLLSTLKQ